MLHAIVTTIVYYIIQTSKTKRLPVSSGYNPKFMKIKTTFRSSILNRKISVFLKALLLDSFQLFT